MISFAFDRSHLQSGIYFRKLLGRTDIEDALKRLDILIQQEVQMAIAQIMKAAGEHPVTHFMLNPCLKPLWPFELFRHKMFVSAIITACIANTETWSQGSR